MEIDLPIFHVNHVAVANVIEDTNGLLPIMTPGIPRGIRDS